MCPIYGHLTVLFSEISRSYPAEFPAPPETATGKRLNTFCHPEPQLPPALFRQHVSRHPEGNPSGERGDTAFVLPYRQISTGGSS